MNQIKPVYKNRDMKVTFAFRNFANASNKYIYIWKKKSNLEPNFLRIPNKFNNHP